MNIIFISMVLATLTGLAGCAGGGGLGDRDPLLRVDDLGTGLPDASSGGPVTIVWKDGVAAVSAAFPATSTSFRLIRVDSRALQTSLDSLLDAVPPQLAFAADEWKARVTVVRDDGRERVVSRDLPMCFVDARCPERLGPGALAAWEAIVQQLQESKEQVDNAGEMRRADELWKGRGRWGQK